MVVPDLPGSHFLLNASTLSIAVAVLWIAMRSIQSRLLELKKNVSDLELKIDERFKDLEEKHYGFRAEVAEKYLRRDEWFAHHNKMEAGLKNEIKELKELLYELIRKAN